MKYLLLLLSALVVHGAELTYNKTLDVRKISDGHIKDAFVNEVKKFSGENVEQDQCIKQLQIVVNGLLDPNPKTFFHSFEVFDSWGKVPSGITYGNLMDVGNFEQCINIDFNSNNANIEGKYCQAKIPILEIIKIIRPNNPTLRSAVEPREIEFPLGLGIGICIPKICDNKKIAGILSQALNGTKVKVNNCSTKERPDFEVVDYVALGIFGAIGLLLILSTFYDFYTGSKPKNPLFLAFSVTHNAQKLFSINTKPNPNSIDCLHGIRALSMIWVIFAHTVLWYLLLPLLNLRTITDWTRTPMALVVKTGVISVDTFFFLSGLLISWIGLKELERTKGKLNVIMMYVHRLFRLWPLLGIVILFILSVLKFCGSGPVWPTYLASQTYLCESTWWRTLLFIQNYENDYICLSQSWYLAVDMQLFLISPLILFGFYKWGKKLIPILVLASALSIGCIYATYVKNDYTTFLTMDDIDPTRMFKTYFPTHVRYTIWVLGITFGYILNQFKDKEVKIPQIYNLLGWAASITVIFSVVFAPYHTQQKGYESSAIEAASYDAFGKVAWGLALSWVIFACHHGHGGVVNTFLSNHLWQVFSKLSFCMYMTHFTMQAVIYGNFQTNAYFSNFDLMGKFWMSFGITIMASIALSLSCEAPIIALEKCIFSRKPKTNDENGRV